MTYLCDNAIRLKNSLTLISILICDKLSRQQKCIAMPTEHSFHIAHIGDGQRVMIDGFRGVHSVHVTQKS
jgi:hypothetical protein